MKHYEELKNSLVRPTLKIYKYESIFEMFNDFMNGLTEEQSTKHLSGLNVQKISNSFGLYIPISNDLKLIALNNEKYNRRTILHEFTHLLQDVIYVEQAETKDEYDETKLDHLNLTEADKKTLLNIMKDKDEIIPYFNEFCELTKDVYEAYYKNENINVFSEFIIDNLTTQTELDETLLNEYRTVGNGDLIPVYVFVCCYLYEVEYEKLRLTLKMSLNLLK